MEWSLHVFSSIRDWVTTQGTFLTVYYSDNLLHNNADNTGQDNRNNASSYKLEEFNWSNRWEKINLKSQKEESEPIYGFKDKEATIIFKPGYIIRGKVITVQKCNSIGNRPVGAKAQDEIQTMCESRMSENRMCEANGCFLFILHYLSSHWIMFWETEK